MCQRSAAHTFITHNEWIFHALRKKIGVNASKVGSARHFSGAFGIIYSLIGNQPTPRGAGWSTKKNYQGKRHAYQGSQLKVATRRRTRGVVVKPVPLLKDPEICRVYTHSSME